MKNQQTILIICARTTNSELGHLRMMMDSTWVLCL